MLKFIFCTCFLGVAVFTIHAQCLEYKGEGVGINNTYATPEVYRKPFAENKNYESFHSNSGSNVAFAIGPTFSCNMNMAWGEGCDDLIDTLSLYDADKKLAFGINLGALFQMQLSRRFALEPGVLYSLKGFRARGYREEIINQGGVTYRTSIDLTFQCRASYLAFPFKVKLLIPATGKVRPYLYCGTVMGICFNNKGKMIMEVDYEDDEMSINDAKMSMTEDLLDKNLEFSLLAGIGTSTDIGFGLIIIDLSYELGLTSEFKDKEVKFKRKYDEFEFVYLSNNFRDIKFGVISATVSFLFKLN